MVSARGVNRGAAPPHSRYSKLSVGLLTLNSCTWSSAECYTQVARLKDVVSSLGGPGGFNYSKINGLYKRGSRDGNLCPITLTSCFLSFEKAEGKGLLKEVR